MINAKSKPGLHRFIEDITGTTDEMWTGSVD